jgi:AcrR family transcriptional regulator
MQLDSTKDKILVVADKLFSRFGFHKTSMDEIAKIARKAKGSLYYHFASKEDLFREVVSNEFINLKSQLKIIIENKDFTSSEKFKHYLIKRMEVLNTAGTYHETLKADFFEHFDFIDKIRNELDEWERIQLRKIISEGIENGEFAAIENIDILLDIFLMTMKGLEIPFYLQGKYVKFSPHFDGLISIVSKGLRS